MRTLKFGGEIWEPDGKLPYAAVATVLEVCHIQSMTGSSFCRLPLQKLFADLGDDGQQNVYLVERSVYRNQINSIRHHIR